MIDFEIAGLAMAVIVAMAALALRTWEQRRPKWSRPVPMDELSVKARRCGIGLLWAEAFLMAVGSLMPTGIRQDVLLFVSIWFIVGIIAVVLIGLTIADALIRLVARKQRAACLRKDLGLLMRSPTNSEPPDDEKDATDDRL